MKCNFDSNRHRVSTPGRRPIPWNGVMTLLISLFVLFFPVHPRDSVHALSIEDETNMGREFVNQIRTHFDLLDDEFANDFINDLGHYLLASLETRHFPFRFYLLKSDTLNAFAAPGGHIFVFSGLIEALDSIDELAAILCHEIGHISARHLAQRIEQATRIGYATLAGILAGVLLGGGAVSEALIVGSQAAGLQAMLSYSRDDERQADQLGFKYMAPTGFDPGGLVAALQKIERQGYLGSSRVPSYLLTHPTGPERMANIASMLEDRSPRPQSGEAIRLGRRYPYFKAAVRAKSLDPAKALARFEPDRQKDPSSPVVNFGLGLLYTETAKYEAAIRHLTLASDARPGFTPVLAALGEAYQRSGDFRKASEILAVALDEEPENKRALFLAGLSFRHTGDCDRAARLFERIIALPGPTSPDVHYHLGLCYGRLNRLALAHYHFGVYFKESGQMQQARFHFRKAEDLAAGDQGLIRRIHEAAGPGR